MGTKEVILRIAHGSYRGHSYSKMLISTHDSYIHIGEDTYVGQAIFSAFFEERESKVDIHRHATYHLSEGDCKLLDLIHKTDFTMKIGFWRQVYRLTRKEIIRRLRERLPLELLKKKME
jgi:hypothetical protein